jgi:3-dehydroquinate synthase
MDLVTKDLYDKGVRQILNFGHTVGHAIERLFAEKKRAVSHGYAIAIGICHEAYLSHKQGFITQQEVEKILQFILRFYKPIEFSDSDLTSLIHYCFDDKKSKHETPRFIFLEKIGKAIPN